VPVVRRGGGWLEYAAVGRRYPLSRTFDLSPRPVGGANPNALIRIP
jgi:hypothetical protein